MQQFTLEIIAKVTGVFYAILHKKIIVYQRYCLMIDDSDAKT